MRTATGWVALFVVIAVSYAVLWNLLFSRGEPLVILILRGAVFASLYLGFQVWLSRRRRDP